MKKHIFIGLDGTMNAAFNDHFHTNVFRLAGAINYMSKDNHQQLFFYYPGVGTQTTSKWLKYLFGATGEGLDLFILEAYVNLVLNYNPNDEIYIFGFSRGAVAARALTGLLSRSGIVDINSPLLIRSAWENFTKDSPDQNYLVDCNGRVHWGEDKKLVKFLGVWDTVTGPIKNEELRTKYRFGDLRLDKCVEHGVHILSMDEQRLDFYPLLWDVPQGADNPLQLWIPGVHSDIGGGYKDSTIANISLLAMLDILVEKCNDIAIDDEYIEEVIFGMCKHQNIAVNDEWADNYISSALGYHYHRDRHLHESYIYHPVVNMMRGKYCSIRGRKGIYNPFHTLSEYFSPRVIQFKNNSYWSRVKPLLTY